MPGGIARVTSRSLTISIDELDYTGDRGPFVEANGPFLRRTDNGTYGLDDNSTWAEDKAGIFQSMVVEFSVDPCKELTKHYPFIFDK